jgi:hypothetical protein
MSKLDDVISLCLPMRLLSLLVLAPDLIALRINVFDGRRIGRNNRTRLWSRVSFIAKAGALLVIFGGAKHRTSISTISFPMHRV